MQHFFVHKFTWPPYSIRLEALGYLRLSRACDSLICRVSFQFRPA